MDTGKVILLKNDNVPTKFEQIEIWANKINHALIVITSFYITWYCSRLGFNKYQHFHAWFAAIGYQLFMSEGILAVYNKNSYTMFIKSLRTKVWVHLGLQIIGGGFAFFAIILIIVKRDQEGRPHFGSSHGKVGLISFTLMGLTMLLGVAAFFAKTLRKNIKPILNKSLHNFISILCYIIGMVAIIIAYLGNYAAKGSDPGNIRYLIIWSLIFITITTLIGPLTTLSNNFFRKETSSEEFRHLASINKPIDMEEVPL